MGRDAPILIDQEGGRVQRLRPPLARNWVPPLEEVERAGEDAARAMYLRHLLIALELRGLGIDANCVPCADVAEAATHPFLSNRCYGTAPEIVTTISRAVAEGSLAGGVLPVVKHIPGHGRGVVDSHEELPSTEASAEDLARRDFAPFHALADLPLGMTAHVVYSAIDSRPATTSPKTIAMIRGDIGFDGLLMTDDLSMNALGGSMAERTRASLAAGCDVILHCNGEMAEMEEVVAEAGRMTPEAERRAARALEDRVAPGEVDIPALEAELRALQGNPAP